MDAIAGLPNNPALPLSTLAHRLALGMDASLCTLLLFGGAALCLAVASGGVWMVADDYRRRVERKQKSTTEREQFRQQVQAVAAEARARRNKSLAWHGLRALRVSAIVDECNDVKSFYLADPEGRPLPSYQPGQYLTLHLPPPPRKVGTPGKPVVRCYSLSDRPREEYYRISVKKAYPPSDTPSAMPGIGTTILHSHVNVGDVLKVAAPRGDFFLPPVGTDPVVLIGAGIGLTPLLSMLLTQAHAGLERETHVLLGMRDSHEYPFKQTVEDLATQHPNLHVFTSYSRPTHRDIEFRDYHRRGRLDMEFVQNVAPSKDARFYLCGPPGMLESLVPGLLDWGVPDDRIHFEAFGPASIHRTGATTAAKSAVGAEVQFTRSGVKANWSEEDTTLLAFAERHGVVLDAGCRVGNCGACAARLLEGGVATVKTPGARPDEGECLTCVSVPMGPMVIEA